MTKRRGLSGAGFVAQAEIVRVSELCLTGSTHNPEYLSNLNVFSIFQTDPLPKSECGAAITCSGRVRSCERIASSRNWPANCIFSQLLSPRILPRADCAGGRMNCSGKLQHSRACHTPTCTEPAI